MPQVPPRWRRIQERIAERVEYRDRFGPLRTVAGVDCAFDDEQGVAACVLLDAGTLETLETRVRRGRVRAPYIPGFLAFREYVLVSAAVRALSRRPDVLLVDGSGAIHPRRAGLACHAGVRLHLPTIGVAKGLLCGDVEGGGLGPERGARAAVRVGGRIVGYALRATAGGRPVFVSTGHRVSPGTAADLALRWSGHRLPEPVRLADAAARTAAHAAPEESRKSGRHAGPARPSS